MVVDEWLNAFTPLQQQVILINGWNQETAELLVRDAFITTWTATGRGPGLNITIPTSPTGTHNFDVYWGDGLSSLGETGDSPHTYATAGDYIVAVTGTLDGIYFANGSERLKIKDVGQWGNLQARDSSNEFSGCQNMTVTATDIWDITGSTNIEFMFFGCTSLTTIPTINDWDWSNVVVCQGTFQNSTLNQELNLNTSSCIGFANFIRGNTSFNSPITLDSTALTDIFGFQTGATAMTYKPTFTQGVGNVWRFVDAIGNSPVDASFADWDVSSATDGTAFISIFNTAMTTPNYDATLIAWDQLTLQTGVPFSFGRVKYSAGAAATARANIISTYSWTITDGGPA